MEVSAQIKSWFTPIRKMEQRKKKIKCEIYRDSMQNYKKYAIRCGCFYGTLAQFRDKVCETHGETKKAQEYLMLADLMDFRFKN